MLPLAAMIGLDWGNDVPRRRPAGDGRVDGRAVSPRPRARRVGRVARDPRTPLRRRGRGDRHRDLARPVVHALLEAPFVVLYPVNPRSLARFREAFVPNGAKDDGPDARLLLALLVKHRALLHPWHRDDVATRTLNRLVQFRRATVDLRTQLTLQLQAALKEYFPQALRWAGDDLATPLAGAFLERWPTLPALQRARARHDSPVLYQPQLPQYGAYHGATGRDRHGHAVDPRSRHSRVQCALRPVLARQLLASRRASTQFDDAIAQRFAAHPDAALFAAVPGAGAASAPRLWSPSAPIARDFHGGRSANECRDRADHRPQWEAMARPLALGHVYLFCAKRFQEFANQSIRQCPGPRVLSSAATTRQDPSCRRTEPRLQMDSDSLALLAGPRALRRRAL